MGTKKANKLSITDVQLPRVRQDILSWRDAIAETEQAWYPFRVKMQRLFADTVLNGHVEACMQKRRDLTLLRDFRFEVDGEDVEDITRLFRQEWFFNFGAYVVDALFYGYSLIALGDIVDNLFSKVDIVRRWNVSPDRKNVSSFVYGISGSNFLEKPYADWHVYVETPNEIGLSYCGNGLLYKVGIYEIFCRNLLGANADFVELYAQPYRVGKTMKTGEDERAELENALRLMGSSGYAIIDPTDEIAFLETALGGTGYKGYDNLEARCEKKISKIILGHADAIDSVPGKLGNDNDSSPAAQALKSIQSRDGRFFENVVNNMLIGKMRNLGFIFPEGGRFVLRNDDEKEEQRRREDESNFKTADIALKMTQAGLSMDAKYFEERTGIPSTNVAKPLPKNVENRLNELYRQ